MIIGFTGTQQGMTFAQNTEFDEIVRNLNNSKKVQSLEFHHGDCKGADEQAHRMMLLYVTPGEIMIHPPTDMSRRAFCLGNYAHFKKKPYLKRNHDIVDACDMLIACPKTDKEILRSGTWATIRYAKKMKKAITIIFPDGSVR